MSQPTSSPVTRIRAHAEAMPHAVALRDKDLGIWREWTWAEYWDQVQLAGHALLELGVVPGDRVAIHSENRPEWLVADMGALAVRTASVGLYPTNPAAEVGYLLSDSGAVVLVVDFGTPIATGTPDEVQRHPDVVRAYLGKELSS